MKVKECMCGEVETIKPDSSICECARLMGEKHIGCIPVCDNHRKIVGIVTDRDILLRSVACNKDSSNTPVSDVMSTKVFCCDCNDDIEEAEKIMSQEQVRRVPVVDQGKVIGILTLGNLAANENIYAEDLSDTIEGICNCNKKNAE